MAMNNAAVTTVAGGGGAHGEKHFDLFRGDQVASFAVLLFEDLTAEAAYDGIWANACLLHVPRPALPGILARVRRALRPGGAFYASFKAGEAEGRDRFGRYYNYPDAGWLRSAYGQDGWSRVEIEEDLGGGYDRETTRWLHATAIKLS